MVPARVDHIVTVVRCPNPYWGYCRHVVRDGRGRQNGGVYQMFQNGAIVWSPTTGSWASSGPIRAAWAKSGFENGRLGYPISGEYSIGSGATEQQFQGGTIKWLPWWNDVAISYK